MNRRKNNQKKMKENCKMTLYVIEERYNKVKSITIYQKMIKRVEKNIS